jgi:hypothetical protein
MYYYCFFPLQWSFAIGKFAGPELIKLICDGTIIYSVLSESNFTYFCSKTGLTVNKNLLFFQFYRSIYQ